MAEWRTVERLTLEYDLAVLPTAQHRAGLAGMLVALEVMRATAPPLPDVPEVEVGQDQQVRLTLTRATLTGVLNYLYTATTEEVRSPTVRKNRNGAVIEPIRSEQETRTDAKTQRQSTRTVYIYPQVVPGAPFLSGLAMPDLWLKLWRDIVWSILRGVPLTRKPYEERAEVKPVSEAGRLWDELVREDAGRKRGQRVVSEVASSLYIGAQATNAERVPFVGSPQENLLLHFWPVVMGIGEVREVKREKGMTREEAAGFVIAVPDVLRLQRFVRTYRGRVAQLSIEPRGYRPRDAVYALPEQGALEYLFQLLELAQAEAQEGSIAGTVAGMEVYQLLKQGNSVTMLGMAKVPAREDVLERYRQVRRNYRNLLVQEQLIRNLLQDRPWFAGFERVFATTNTDLVIGKEAGFFAIDVSKRFRADAEVK